MKALSKSRTASFSSTRLEGGGAVSELLVPPERVLPEGRVELRVCSEAGHEGGLVVRRAPHEAVTEARPGGDGLSCVEQFLRGLRGLEELVRADAVIVHGR